MLCNGILPGVSAQKYMFCSAGWLLFSGISQSNWPVALRCSEKPQGLGPYPLLSVPTVLRYVQITLWVPGLHFCPPGATLWWLLLSANRQPSIDLSLGDSAVIWSPSTLTHCEAWLHASYDKGLASHLLHSHYASNF